MSIANSRLRSCRGGFILTFITDHTPGQCMEHIVYVVDDDDAVRQSVVGLLESAGLNAIGFSSAEALLQHPFEDNLLLVHFLLPLLLYTHNFLLFRNLSY